jgi:hypothetical protein
MGMKSIFQAAAKVAFSVAGDIKKSCTYTQAQDDGINDEEVVSWSIDVLFGEFSREEKRDLKILPGDVKGTVLFSDMEVEPIRGDEVLVISSDVTFSVFDFSSDPAEATYVLHLRTV